MTPPVAVGRFMTNTFLLQLNAESSRIFNHSGLLASLPSSANLAPEFNSSLHFSIIDNNARIIHFLVGT
jgi:hypothetical protein